MNHKITNKDIFNYIEGNARLLAHRFSFLSGHIQEQVAYRMMLCKDDCMITGKCKHCGCTVPDRMYSSSTCNNGERFPDMMNEQDWNKFKIDNNIE